MPGDEPIARQNKWLQKNINFHHVSVPIPKGAPTSPTSWASYNVVEVRLRAPRDLSVKIHEDRTVLTYSGHLIDILRCAVRATAPYRISRVITIRNTRQIFVEVWASCQGSPPRTFLLPLKFSVFNMMHLPHKTQDFCIISQNKQTLFPQTTLTYIYAVSGEF
jgi:hypothetical protein